MKPRRTSTTDSGPALDPEEHKSFRAVYEIRYALAGELEQSEQAAFAARREQ